MADSRNGPAGHTVQKVVVVGLKIEIEPVLIPAPDMVVCHVVDFILNMEVAIITFVPLMVDSQIGVFGLLVQTLAVEVCQVENDFVTIQNLSMKEIIALVCSRKLEFAIKYPVQSMAVSANGICGVFVLFHVAVD